LKKGSMHIDWMISMGIFLMIFLAILLFFKPGSETAYQGDYLISLVESRLVKETYYAIERTPIAWDSGLPSKEFVEFGFNGNFPACDDDENNFGIVKPDFQYIDFKIDGLSCNSNQGDGKIWLRTSDLSGLSKFYVFYSDEIIYTNNNANIECRLTPGGPGQPQNCERMNNDDFKVGVNEIIKGLNSVKLTRKINDLDGNYTGTKTSWGYPQSKEFKICKDSFNNCKPGDDVKKIPDNANVFAKEIRMNALNKDTTLDTTRVEVLIIRAW